MTEKAQFLGQVDKLTASRTLHGSESLCKLLRYLATHSLEHPGASPKEYQIATEVFGRQPDFDPHLDSMVRVQAGRLRSKLSEYYSTEGIEDPLLIEIPKGNYVLTVHPRTPNVPRNNSVTTPEIPPAPVAAVVPPRRWVSLLVPLFILLAAVAGILADRYLLTAGRSSESRAVNEISDAPVSLRTFWRGFLTSPQEPWVVFSNAAFVGKPATGMRYYHSPGDAKAGILDHYTGVGEVLAVHALDKVFNQLHQDLRVKRGSLFSLDDAKNNDLIFIGSPSENLTLLELPGTKEFTFEKSSAENSEGEVEILNVHPEAGEPHSFRAGRSGENLLEDYSLIALKPGLNPARSVLILAGTTTIGTQAAVEFVCQQSSLDELLRRLSVSNPRDLKPFEAVIRVKVTHGVPIEMQLVALRKVP
ncbi:MAG TPA: hypothetical protein VN982_11490 [Candidatus Dormibacteraeota bacterium]|nr:hypothetical protein [Candidatus Dormibacteraeota bacterium]